MRLGGPPSRAPCFVIGVNYGTTNYSHALTTLVTTDKRLADEQTVLPLAVIAVDDKRLPALLAAVNEIANAIQSVDVGEHRIVAIGA